MFEMKTLSINVLVHGDDEPMSALVVIGDGTDPQDWEGNPGYDERIFYYFYDEAEFEEARTIGTEYFKVVD